MAGFHPAARRRIVGQQDDNNKDDGVGIGIGGDQHDENDTTNDANTNNKNANTNAKANDDDIESDSSSDYDQPYHETAANWYTRHARRRARRLAGISSSSSSSGSSSDCSSVENDDDDGLVKRDVKRREMKKAVRSANRPFEKWLASYPLVAARCCLSSIPSTSTATVNTMTSGANNRHGHGKEQFNSSDTSPLPPREQEINRLRRIFRRIRRKQKEFQARFIDIHNTTSSSPFEQANNNNSSYYYQNSNALSLEKMMTINQESAESESDRIAIHSFLPQGTGISFIDAVLARESKALLVNNNNNNNTTRQRQQQQQQQKTMSRLVLELNGPPRSGMTSIMIALAARYVASTCNLFLDSRSANNNERSSSSRPSKRRRKNHSTTTRHVHVTEPRVVILDVEKGVHAVKLVLSVREAVLRRWDETAAARELKKEQERQWTLDDQSEAGHKEDAEDYYRDSPNNNTMEEQHQIERAIASCLGRINVVQPQDFTYLSLVATIEALSHSLDKERGLKYPPAAAETKKQPSRQFGHPKRNNTPSYANITRQQLEPPTLILIDSLSTLDASTRFQESLSGSARSSGGSGLSDRNEFYRQLIRLREEHEIAIIGASRCIPSANDHQASWGPPGGKRVGAVSIWDKMVSHRVALHHVVEGTMEDRAGYDFVATLNANGNQGGTNVFPYSVTAGGIAC